jgi:hypothetical protein
MVSLPHRAKKLLELARQGRFPKPSYLEIHTGAENKGCDSLIALEVAASIGVTRLHIVPATGLPS